MLKQWLVENLNYQQIYDDLLGKTRNNVTCCPFHDDSNPSFSYALINGGAKCHADSCGVSFGNVVHFYAAYKKITEEQAAIELYSTYVRKVIKHHNFLELTQTQIANLQKQLGISFKTIKQFEIKFDTRSGRYVFPVYDQWGLLVNFRFYRPPKERKNNEAKIYSLKGYGSNDLFFWKTFLKFDIEKPVFVVIAEREVMLAHTLGLQAITITAGESALFKNSDKEFLKPYKLYVVRGQDSHGLKSGAILAESLCAKIVDLPFSKEEIQRGLKDFADWLLSKKPERNIKTFLQFCKTDNVVAIKNESVIYPSENANLATIFTSPNYRDKVVKIKAIVAARSDKKYQIPFKFKIYGTGNSPARIETISLSRKILSFFDASDETIYRNFGKDRVEALEYITAYVVELIPTVLENNDTPYIVQRCVYFGNNISNNLTYEFDAIPTTHPKTQEVIGILKNAKPVYAGFNFNFLDTKNLESLEMFKPAFKETSWNCICKFAKILEKETRIYNREDWHIVALLTWASPLYWRFSLEENIQRGWINSLVLGDTETGKSQVCKKFVELFKSGNIVSAENCTLVGLVGGTIKTSNGQFMLRWGRIPLMDKQLVVIEELSGLSIEQISKLSDIRSAGIARLDKGGISSETFARTRLLCLSNPRSFGFSGAKTLAQYSSGVKAVHDLIGNSEDIARFDLILTLTDSEVSIDRINSMPVYSSNKISFDWDKLIKFCWSLNENQIIWTKEAYNFCLKETKRFSDKYHPAIPIFKGGSGRYKIGRLAVAIACATFSWNNGAIIIKSDHVRSATILLDLLYCKESLGYDVWSQQLYHREVPKNVEEIILFLESNVKNVEDRVEAMDQVLHVGKFTRDEICAVFGFDTYRGDKLIGLFLRKHLIKKSEANTWELTGPGKTFIKDYISSLTVT